MSAPIECPATITGPDNASQSRQATTESPLAGARTSPPFVAVMRMPPWECATSDWGHSSIGSGTRSAM